MKDLVLLVADKETRKISLRRCGDEAFLRLRAQLLAWFSN